MSGGPRVRLAALVFCGLVAACADGPALSTDMTVADSAGVRVVSNTNSIGRASGWTIDATPLLRVGWTEGDPEFQSVTFGVLRSDGVTVVADDRAGQLYAIPPDGGPILTMGGKGDGPGEFNSINGLVSLGSDSLLVADARNRRVTILDGAGTMLSETTYQPMHGFAGYGVSARVDGILALVPFMTGGNANEEPGWKSFPVFRASDVANLEAVIELPLTYTAPRGSNNPVQQSGRVRAGRDGFVHARSDLPQVSWYGLDGSLLQVVRWDQELHEVDDQDWAALEAQARTSMRLPDERMDELLDRWRADFSGTMPLFGLMHVDHAGNVWLGAAGIFIRWEDRFRVISAEGEWLGSVDFPSPVWVLDITDTHALVVEKDDLDVQAVSLYEISKR